MSSSNAGETNMDLSRERDLQLTTLGAQENFECNSTFFRKSRFEVNGQFTEVFTDAWTTETVQCRRRCQLLAIAALGEYYCNICQRGYRRSKHPFPAIVTSKSTTARLAICTACRLLLARAKRVA